MLSQWFEHIDLSRGLGLVGLAGTVRFLMSRSPPRQGIRRHQTRSLTARNSNPWFKVIGSGEEVACAIRFRTFLCVRIVSSVLEWVEYLQHGALCERGTVTPLYLHSIRFVFQLTFHIIFLLHSFFPVDCTGICFISTVNPSSDFTLLFNIIIFS